MFELFKHKSETGSAEEIFWNWFVNNKNKIEKFIDSKNPNYSIYNKLTTKIQSYNSILFPELTKTENDNYVLIITPDGDKEGVEPTKKLAQACPTIENWVVQKFRQPCDEITLNINGLEYPSDDIEIIPTIDLERDVVDIAVFIRNMNEDEKKYQCLAFLYFDHILGEYNSIMKVGYIDFYHLEKDKSVSDSITLLQLRNMIAKELY